MKRIKREIRNIQAGVRGESEASYEMKVHYGDSKNWMILNDLQIEHGDLAAQIDHLLINRFMEMYVCESKNFSEGVAINEHSEFSAFWGNKPYGVPSPIEQRMLLDVDENGKINPSTYASQTKATGLDIIAWTLERSGFLEDGGGWYYQTAIDVIDNDGDMMNVLDVLAREVGILGIFSDWPATVTYYANCMDIDE